MARKRPAAGPDLPTYTLVDEQRFRNQTVHGPVPYGAVQERTWVTTAGWDVARRSYWLVQQLKGVEQESVIARDGGRIPAHSEYGRGKGARSYYFLHHLLINCQHLLPEPSDHPEPVTFYKGVWELPLVARQNRLLLLSQRWIDRESASEATELLEPLFEDWTDLPSHLPAGSPEPPVGLDYPDSVQRPLVDAQATYFPRLRRRDDGPDLTAGYDLLSERYFIAEASSESFHRWRDVRTRIPRFRYYWKHATPLAPRRESTMAAEHPQWPTLGHLVGATWDLVDWPAELDALALLRGEPVAIDRWMRLEALGRFVRDSSRALAPRIDFSDPYELIGDPDYVALVAVAQISATLGLVIAS